MFVFNENRTFVQRILFCVSNNPHILSNFIVAANQQGMIQHDVYQTKINSE